MYHLSFHVIYQPVPKVRPDAHTHKSTTALQGSINDHDWKISRGQSKGDRNSVPWKTWKEMGRIGRSVQKNLQTTKLRCVNDFASRCLEATGHAGRLKTGRAVVSC